MITCNRHADALAHVQEEINELTKSEHQSLTLIANTQKQAARMHRALSRAGLDARLLETESGGFSTGVIVGTAYMAKGLECDRVIILDASASHYADDTDRGLLFVACTRAMYRLTLISVGTPSPLLPTHTRH